MVQCFSWAATCAEYTALDDTLLKAMDDIRPPLGGILPDQG
jgi:hypothetical protein